jgi:hypothetical protein
MGERLVSIIVEGPCNERIVTVDDLSMIGPWLTRLLCQWDQEYNHAPFNTTIRIGTYR